MRNIKLTIDANIQSTVYDIYSEDNISIKVQRHFLNFMTSFHIFMSTPSYF